MSEYAVHFTKDGEDGASAYDNMMAILYGGVLRAGVRAYGAVTWLANRWPEIAESHRCVCLSEIPLDQLDRLVEKRSQYGIGFRKTFLAEEGGVRVWYIDKEEAGGRAVRAYVSSEAERAEKAWDATDPIFNLTPFIDPIGEYAYGSYRFDWEREWRVRTELRFGVEDVPFLFIPGELHGKAFEFFEDVERENTGPAYLCPYIDPLWPDDKIQAALATVAPPPAPPPPPLL
jgi:hypothetical protein